MESTIVSRLKLFSVAIAVAIASAVRPDRVDAAANEAVEPQLTPQQQIDQLRQQTATLRATLATVQQQLATAQAQLAKLATHTHLYDPPGDNATATLADINLWNKMNINQTNMVFMMHTGGYTREALTGPPYNAS